MLVFVMIMINNLQTFCKTTLYERTFDKIVQEQRMGSTICDMKSVRSELGSNFGGPHEGHSEMGNGRNLSQTGRHYSGGQRISHSRQSSYMSVLHKENERLRNENNEVKSEIVSIKARSGTGLSRTTSQFTSSGGSNRSTDSIQEGDESNDGRDLGRASDGSSSNVSSENTRPVSKSILKKSISFGM